VNKAELVEEVAKETGLTKKTSREAVNAIISAITDSLSREEKVTSVGFGTFQVRGRKARRGVNLKCFRPHGTQGLGFLSIFLCTMRPLDNFIIYTIYVYTCTNTQEVLK